MKLIKWDKQAILQLNNAIGYIRKDSPHNAETVKLDILEKVTTLAAQPDIHPPDKYKTNNIGNYRVSEQHRLRVSYLVKAEEVIITRIRYTKQKTKEY